MEVFDRWVGKIFESNDISIGRHGGGGTMEWLHGRQIPPSSE
jgi:hypothetical protein